MTISWQPRLRTNYIIVHDSHTKPDVANIESYLSSKGRTMGLLEIGYHYLIDREADIIAPRPDHLMGNHTPGHNRISVAVCLIGGRDENDTQQDNFTPEQMDTCGFLLAYLAHKFGNVKPLRILGHTELQRFKDRPLTCPACSMDDVRAHAERYREYIEQYDRNDMKVLSTKSLSQQRALIIEYLKARVGRELTNRRALLELGIGSLSSRIAELRRDGYEIKDKWVTDGHGVRLKAYYYEEHNDA